MADRVLHQLDDQLDDDLVQPAVVEGRHPGHGEADVAVLAGVRDDHLGRELLHDEAQQVRRPELPERRGVPRLDRLP